MVFEEVLIQLESQPFAYSVEKAVTCVVLPEFDSHTLIFQEIKESNK